MKPIQRSKTFEKNFNRRVARDKKLVKQFRERYKLFAKGERDYPINAHTLTGALAGKRAWSVANDIRVIYIETDSAIIFIDIGSHNQVYK